MAEGIRPAAALAGLAALVWAGAAFAQSLPPERGRASLLPVQAAPAPAVPATGTFRLIVPPVLLAEPASELALPIEIVPSDGLPANSFVRIRGLPPTAALTEGHAIAPGAWAVPASALGNLRISLPVGLAGKSEITVSLATIDGGVVAETKTALVIAAAGLIAPTAPAPAPPPLPVAPAVPKAIEASPPKAVVPLFAPAPPPLAQPTPVTPIPPPPAVERSPPPATTVTPAPPAQPAPDAGQRALGFMARGFALLAEGNVASARLFFERAADEGHADGALAMGGTFDPAELARFRTQSVQPDPRTARRWYERARALGSTAAAERLERLDRR